MKICYIAPVTLTASTVTTNQNMIEKAISDAINSTIVQPFQEWLLNGWIKFVGVSYWICLAIATTGVVCAICGIPKGKSLAVKSIIFYIIIRMVSWYNGWQ